MIQYDSKVIYRLAADLYSRARFLVLVYTVTGALIGSSIGKAYSAYASAVSTWNTITAAPTSSLLGALGMGQTHAQPSPPPATSWTLLGVLIAGLIGFWIGWNKSSILKLQAQTVLCQAKIEENTRNGVKVR